jgi:ABC-type uncharacterized transport system ATPase subunit
MEYVVEMLNITKVFSGIVANDDVSLQVKKGEIHALLGENGAGKSTLMSVLFGIYQPEKGKIRIRGKDVRINNPKNASDMGIGMVHQHFKLVKDFTVLENIILGVESAKLGILQMEEARERVLKISKKYNMMINPDAKISEITVGMQQRVEILKMLYRDNNILIFDEPTAVLTPQEIEELMKIMKDMANEGKSIIFITHKLNEIKAVADKCTVLRHGKCIGTVDVKDTTKEEMSEMMVGRKISFNIEKSEFKPGEPVLSVKNLSKSSKHSGKKILNNISFDIRKGEILSIAGIDGNGQSELVAAITGLNPCDEGKIVLGNHEISKESIRYRNINGLAHIPEDRHKHGLILDFSLEDNLILKRYFTKQFSPKGFLLRKMSRAFAETLIKDFDIRSGEGLRTRVRSMSGGNQQKAIIAREIDTDHEVLIAVQPTRGLDIGAIEYIHKQLIAERDAGKAILLVSFEIDEVMDISDRILVMYEGEVIADLDPKKTTVNELGLYMAGSKRSVVE